MQIKMQNILNFTIFYEAVKSQKLSMKTAYRIAQLSKAIEHELEFYRTKLREIVEEHSEKDENGNPIPTADGGIKICPGHETECYTSMQELQELEVELPDIKFTIEEFEKVELEPDIVGAIFPFIEE